MRSVLCFHLSLRSAAAIRRGRRTAHPSLFPRHKHRVSPGVALCPPRFLLLGQFPTAVRGRGGGEAVRELQSFTSRRGTARRVRCESAAAGRAERCAGTRRSPGGPREVSAVPEAVPLCSSVPSGAGRAATAPFPAPFASSRRPGGSEPVRGRRHGGHLRTVMEGTCGRSLPLLPAARPRAAACPARPVPVAVPSCCPRCILCPADPGRALPSRSLGGPEELLGRGGTHSSPRSDGFHPGSAGPRSGQSRQSRDGSRTVHAIHVLFCFLIPSLHAEKKRG